MLNESSVARSGFLAARAERPSDQTSVSAPRPLTMLPAAFVMPTTTRMPLLVVMVRALS